MTIKKEDDRRGAQRITIPKPVPATLSGFEGKLLEISLIGCLVEHVDRVLPKARLPLRFKWRGSEVRIEATVIRSEMRLIFGRPAYVSGLEFCATQEESPQVVREIVGWLAKQAGSSASAPSPEPSVTPAPAPEPPPPPAKPAPAVPPPPPPAKPAPAVPPAAPPAKPAPAVPPAAPPAKPAPAAPPVAPPAKPAPAVPPPTPPAAPFFKPEVPASRPASPKPAAPPKPAPQRVHTAPAAAPKTVSAPAPTPPVQEEVEVLSADYLQCTFDGREWTKLYVIDPTQPANGFTVLAPPEESEVDVLCRAYEKANAERRREMRKSFELAIARNRR